MMKRISLFALMLILCILMVGCSNNNENNPSSDTNPTTDTTSVLEEKYNTGVEAMNSGDWEAAIACFSELDYQDSKDLLDKCITEKGMHEKSDYTFLEAMGESLMKRYEMSEKTDDAQKCVETELEMIAKYKEAEFYDSELQKLAVSYIEGVEIEKQSFSEEYGHMQLKYYEGHAKRFEALKKLTDNYDFLADNVDYKVNYYNKADEEISAYTAIQEIEADLDKQIGENTECEWLDDVNCRIQICNNTKYNYDMLMHFIFKDVDGAITYTNDMYYEDIQAGTKYNLDFYFPENADSVEWYTEEYIKQ